MQGALLKNEETWAWETYRPQQSFMSSIFCSCESSQCNVLQCRSALSFLAKDWPHKHKKPIYVLSSIRYKSILPVALAMFTCSLNPNKIERTLDILLSMQCFFRWSRMDLSSNLICTCFSHWRQHKPNGENVKSSPMHDGGKTAGERSSRPTTMSLDARLVGPVFRFVSDDSMMMMMILWMILRDTMCWFSNQYQYWIQQGCSVTPNIQFWTLLVEINTKKSLPTNLLTYNKALPMYLLNICILEDFLSTFTPAP